MQSAVKELVLLYVRTVWKTVGEASEDGAHRLREYCSYFSRFIGLELLNTHTRMSNARLCKYPRQHDNFGHKWNQTAEKENTCNVILDLGSS